MNSRVLNPPTVKLDKKIKPLTIKTNNDILSIKNMTKHKSQEVYIQKSTSKEKIKNKQLILENKKNLNQLSPKTNKNKQALSPRILSPNMGTKTKSVKNSNNTKKNNNSKHSLDKIMSDDESCQEIESEEEKSNGHKSNYSSSSEIIDEREYDVSSPITEKLQKYNEIKFANISANPFMTNSSKEQSINKENSSISIDNYKNNEYNNLYNKLLNLAKKGDRELFLENLEKILNLPNNLGDINFRDENGFSALHYSCDEGNLKIVEILLKANCNCNIRTNDKKTPLHFTAIRGYFDISKLLIENGAVLNVYDNEKNTPLHYSSMNGHYELLKYFLGKLPQADTQNIYGKTALDVAKKEEIKLCLKKYIEKKETVYHKIKIHNTTETNVKNMMRNFSPKQDNNNKVVVQKTQNTININIQTNINDSNNNSNNNSNYDKIINTEGNENVKSNMKKSNTSQAAFIVNSTNKLLKHYTTNNSITTKSKSKTKTKQNSNNNVRNCNNNKSHNNNNNNNNKSNNHNQLSTSTNKKPNTANTNISKKNSLSNFSLHSQFSNRKKTSNKILNSSEKNIPNGNLHKTKTLQKFTINNPFIKGLKSQKTLSNKKNSIPGSEKKQNITNNSINITSTSIDTSISRLNKTEDNSNIKNLKSNNKNLEEENCLDSIEEERITPSSFVCLALLGKGSFGEVYLVQKINSGSYFAMKVLSKDKIMGQNLLKYAMAERNVLSLSNHPFIVKLNFAFQTLSKLFLILDYCPGGDLSKHLYHEKRFIEPRAKFYICEILLALEDLHKRDIIFRDLKPDNVVLDSEGHCKLTDFGLSKEGVFDSQCAKSFCGSIAYLAPEMLKKQGHGKAVDWYLLGVLFYEMLIGIPPFFTEKREDIFYNIEYGELQIPKFISKDASNLLRDLLQKDPSKRLGGGIKDSLEIKEHYYFKDVNWDDVYNKKVIPPKMKRYSKALQTYNRPRLFANDDNYDVYNTEGNAYNNNQLPGWSFINNDEI